MKAAIVEPKMKNKAASEMKASTATIRKQNNQPTMSKGSRKQKSRHVEGRLLLNVISDEKQKKSMH